MNRHNKGFAMGIFLLTFLVLGSVSASLIYVSSLNDVSSRSANSKINGRFLANTISDYVYAKVQSDPKFIENATDSTKCLVLATTNPGINCNLSFSTPGVGYVKLNKGIESNNLIGTQANSLDSNLLTMDKKTGESRFVSCSINDKEECASYYLKKSTNLSTGNYADRVYGVKVFIKVKSGCGNIKTCRTTTYSSVVKPNQFFDYMYYVKYATLDPIFYTNAYPAYVNPTLYSTCKDRFFNARTGIAARSASCVSVALTNLDNLNGADIYTSDDYFTVCGNPQNIGQAYSSDPNRFGKTSLISASDLSVNAGDTACPSLGTANTNNGTVDLDLTLYGKAYDGAKNLSNVINIGSGGYLTINNGNYSTGGSCSSAGIPLPDSSIIISSGNINICGISGTTKKISIVSGGDVIVKGDITYDAASNGVVSIVADGNIKIEQKVATICAESLTRTVEAYMVSINSSIFTENWWQDSYSAINDSPACQSIPTKVSAKLIIKGSLVGKYQPIFGTYNGASVDANNLDLLSGYKKEFTFDSRVKKGTVSIPYVIPPKTQQWVKLALTEIASTNN